MILRNEKRHANGSARGLIRPLPSVEVRGTRDEDGDVCYLHVGRRGVYSFRHYAPASLPGVEHLTLGNPAK